VPETPLFWWLVSNSLATRPFRGTHTVARPKKRKKKCKNLRQKNNGRLFATKQAMQ
jgi:hypothetical protein